MTGHGAKYGRKQEEAIAALLTQRNVEEAAKSIKVSTKTLIRWMKLPSSKPRIGKLAGPRLDNPLRACNKVHLRRHRRC